MALSFPVLSSRLGTGIDNRATLDRLMDGLNWDFGLIRDANPGRWEDGRDGRVCSNFGVPGYIRLLGEIVRHLERRDAITTSEMKLADLRAEIKPILLPMLSFLATATNARIEERFNVKFGSGGIRQYYFALSQIINEARPEFQPQGFEEWKSDITKDEQEKADKDAKWIQDRVHALVVDRLHVIYGRSFF